MAQLVLGAAGAVIGGIVGGPAGAQLGFALGSALGGAMSATSTHQDGPRLTDLKVTGTDYGSPIPWIKGAPRIACQFWWASERREISTTTSQGGKGGPSSTSTTFTYEVDLLCGLTDGMIAGVTRIWWNGKLVWTNLSSADDQSRIDSQATDYWRRLTVYTGSTGQLPDATYEAAVTDAPAYRGRSAVFLEGVQLGGSGQFPNLTFEVCTSLAASPAIVRRQAVTNTGKSFSNQLYPPNNLGRPAIVAMQPQVRVAVIASPVRSTVYEFDIAGAFRTLSTRTGAAENYPGDYIGYSYPVGLIDGQPVRWQNGGTASGSAGHRLLPVGTLDDIGSEIVAGADLAAVIASGRYVGGVALCSGGQHGIIFTGPSSAMPGGSVLDQWHLVRRQSGVTTLIRQGALETTTAIYTFGFGNCAVYHFGSSMLEDNLQHVWVAYTPSGSVSMYRIDDDNVLRLKAQLRDISGSRAGICSGNTFESPSIWAQAGFCFVVSGPSFSAFARSGDSITTIPLNAAVQSLCARAGLSSTQYDTSALAGVTKPVRALAVSQVGSTRSTLEQLQAAYFFDASLSDKIYFRPRAAASVKTIPYTDLAAGVDKATDQPFELAIASDLELPAQVAVQFRNMSDDQRTGTEYSDRLISGQASLNTVQLALGFTPAEAKGIADAIVADSLSSLTTTTIALPMAYADLEPADVVTVVDHDGSTYRLRINRKTDDGGVQRFDAAVDDAAVVVSAQITSAAYTESVSVRVAADTVLYSLDIPLLRDADDGAGFYVAASGATTNWPGCAALISSNNVEFTSAAVVAEPAVMGSCTTILAAWLGGPVMDELTSVTVSVGDGQLASATRAAMLADDALNVMLIGSELIRFTLATLVSPAPNVYKLTRLMRGQRGTEWAMAGHASNERAVLLSPQGLRRVSQQTTDLNTTRYVKGVTIGRSPSTVSSSAFVNTGESSRPLAPVDLRISRTAADDLLVTWKRRTRKAATFCGPTGIRVPVGEAAESYAVQIVSGGVTMRNIVVQAPELVYTRAQAQVDYGVVPAQIFVRVQQISASYGSGREIYAALDVPAPISDAAAVPGAPLPGPPAPTVNAKPSNVIAKTASGVLAMRIEAGVPVYYTSSGATMIALGMASTAFMSSGHYADGLSFQQSGIIWYVGSLGDFANNYFAVSAPDDFSAAPVAYSGGSLLLPDPGGPDTPAIIGSNGTKAIGWSWGNRVFTTTSYPTPWTYIGLAAPDASVGWSGPYSYFPSFVRGGSKLLPTTAGWLLAGSNLYGGLWVYRTTDADAAANWINCSAVSQTLLTYDANSFFFDASASGARCYLAATLRGQNILAVSSDSGVSWTKYSTSRQYIHLMSIGATVVAISADAKWAAINDGSGTSWSEYQTVGLGGVPSSLVSRPRGNFFIDTSYPGGDVIVYTADGINWSPVA